MNRRIAQMSLAGVALAAGTASGVGVRYDVVDLGAAPPGANPSAMSEAGHVTGLYFSTTGQRRAFVWHEGASADIGTLGGIAQSSDVNDSGMVVGYSVDTEGRQHAIRVVNGVMTSIGTLHGGIHANANGVNDSGWIVGMSQRRFGNDTWQRAALWRNGTVLDLGTFGGEYSEATAVNNAGQVVGWAWHPFPGRQQHAFMWSDSGGLVDLGTLGGGFSIASDINDAGVVVGTSHTAPAVSASHGFVWTAQGGMVDLGAPAGTNDSVAAAVNNRMQIVGYSFDPVECTVVPILWEEGALQRLDTMIDPALGWTLVQPHDINDRGEIAASARMNGGPYRAVLLVPRTMCSPDFDGDGDSGTDADIDAFFACLGGNCCAACGSADFDGDSDVGTDADIESFFRVMGGGAC